MKVCIRRVGVVVGALTVLGTAGGMAAGAALAAPTTGSPVSVAAPPNSGFDGDNGAPTYVGTETATAKPGDVVDFEGAIQDNSFATATGNETVKVSVNGGATLTDPQGGNTAASCTPTSGATITCTDEVSDFDGTPIKGYQFEIVVPAHAAGTITAKVSVSDSNGSASAKFYLTIVKPSTSHQHASNPPAKHHSSH